MGIGKWNSEYDLCSLAIGDTPRRRSEKIESNTQRQQLVAGLTFLAIKMFTTASLLPAQHEGGRSDMSAIGP
jgi:hypothetical protein